MKINKNIKALFTLSKFLANYCWLYFLFLAIAALFPLNHYINSATQATLLILCVPLLILKNFLTAREIKKLKQELYEITAHHTGKSIEQIAKDSDRDFWMTAQEAKEYGMIDEVLKIRDKK